MCCGCIPGVAEVSIHIKKKNRSIVLCRKLKYTQALIFILSHRKSSGNCSVLESCLVGSPAAETELPISEQSRKRRRCHPFFAKRGKHYYTKEIYNTLLSEIRRMRSAYEILLDCTRLGFIILKVTQVELAFCFLFSVACLVVMAATL